MNKLPECPKVLVEAMIDSDTYHMFEAVVLYHFKKRLQNLIISKFSVKLESSSFTELTKCFEELYHSLLWFKNYTHVWHDCDGLTKKIKDQVKAMLQWTISHHMKNQFTKMIAYVFQFHLNREDVATDDITFEWEGQFETWKIMDFNDFVENKFSPLVSKWLVELDLVEMLIVDAVRGMLEIEIERFVIKTCRGVFDRGWMTTENGGLVKWIGSKVVPFLRVIFYKNMDEPEWDKTLCFILYGAYTKLRVGEMLDIITDFPESTPTILELKRCLQHTRQRPRLIDSLKKDITNRVLHPGVSTENIIAVYISAVKALRELDSSGVVMEMVLGPCTAYLTQRDDAVRMIMQGLLGDEDSNDLADELANSQETEQSRCWNERVTETPEDWHPDPREADPYKLDKSSRTSDIVTLFIGMYGSKEKFICEYQKLLSKRLLQIWYDEKSESAEIRNLELLKMRFGEEDMGKCSVMLKDIADSKRINSHISDGNYKEEKTGLCNIRTMIMSSEFWPTVVSQDLEIPCCIADLLKQFNKGFESLKASRSLKWLVGLGMVKIEIEINGKNLEFKVPPLQATLILHFAEKDVWSLTELSNHMLVAPTVLRRKILFWVQRGILRQCTMDTFMTNEKHPNSIPPPSDISTCLAACEEEEEEDKTSSDAEQEKRKKDNKMFWFYIKGMLKNFQSLPLDRIHKMLQMFAINDSNMQIELSQLKRILNENVQQGYLVIEAGKFKLTDDMK